MFPLLGGIAISLFILPAHLSRWMHDHEARTWLYSLFFGGIIGSIPLCFRRVQQWGVFSLSFLTIGAFITFGISYLPAVHEYFERISFPFHWEVFFFLCGALAICAALLPGISGSTLLVVMGAYPFIIDALARLRIGDFSAFRILFPFGVGVLIGGIGFVGVIQRMLSRYSNTTYAFLTGCLFGALPALWPYWQWEGGVPMHAIIPKITHALEQRSLALIIATALLFYGVERYRTSFSVG